MFHTGLFYFLPPQTINEALALLEKSKVAPDVRAQCIASINDHPFEDEKGKKLFGGFCYSDNDYQGDVILKFVNSCKNTYNSLRPGSVAQFLKYRERGYPCPDCVLLILDEERGIVITFDEGGFRSSVWEGEFLSEYKLFLVKEE